MSEVADTYHLLATGSSRLGAPLHTGLCWKAMVKCRLMMVINLLYYVQFQFLSV